VQLKSTVRYETVAENDSGPTFEETLGMNEGKMVIEKWHEHLHEVFREY
jgi:hypothetical protein